MRSLVDDLQQTIQAGGPAILVEIIDVKGSTPREADALMLVTAEATAGTVGGGQLEWQAIHQARKLLGSQDTQEILQQPLGPELGQCCGGHVTLSLHRATAADVETLKQREADATAGWQEVLMFGAGHVGRAIANALAPLPFRLRWIDERQEQFPPGADKTVTTKPVDEVDSAQPGAAYLVLTHDHMLDFRITEAVLQRSDFAYLGLIGSKSKRARFERGFRELGLDSSRLVCPIGSTAVHDKRPEVIATLVAAELLHIKHGEQHS